MPCTAAFAFAAAAFAFSGNGTWAGVLAIIAGITAITAALAKEQK